jgi:isopentenyl phosphate kinase
MHTSPNHSQRQIHIIKIGGSLSTVRGSYKTPRLEAITRIAAAITTWQQQGSHRVVLIIGGGSFAHDVINRFDLQSNNAEQPNHNIFELTQSIFELKVLYARAFSKQCRLAIPLQETIFSLSHGSAINGEERLQLSDYRTLYACFKIGAIPLLSGGIVPSKQGFVMVSSDFIARPLANSMAAQRVVMFTDQPGIMRNDEVINRISLSDEESIFRHFKRPTRLDVTGGIASKFAAAIEIAKDGIEVLITDGRDIDANSLESAFCSTPHGTLIVPTVSTGSWW